MRCRMKFLDGTGSLWYSKLSVDGPIPFGFAVFWICVLGQVWSVPRWNENNCARVVWMMATVLAGWLPAVLAGTVFNQSFGLLLLLSRAKMLTLFVRPPCGQIRRVLFTRRPFPSGHSAHSERPGGNRRNCRFNANVITSLFQLIWLRKGQKCRNKTIACHPCWCPNGNG